MAAARAARQNDLQAADSIGIVQDPGWRARRRAGRDVCSMEVVEAKRENVLNGEIARHNRA
jgi:hypothetical protein